MPVTSMRFTTFPPTPTEYSSLREDITAAMRAGIQHTEGKVVPNQVGHGFAAHNVLAASRHLAVEVPVGSA